MIELCGFFGDVTDSRYYTQVLWLDFVRDFRTNGYVHGAGSELVVSQHSPPAMSVNAATGEAWVQGNYCVNDAVETITIDAADPVYGRIDRVVIRNFIVGTRLCSFFVLKGEASGSPVAPELSRTDDVWDICLAEVAVGAGAESIVTANISDMRDDEYLCGVANPIAVRFSDIITGDNFDANSHPFADVALPTADNDGVTLQHRNLTACTLPIGVIYAFAASAIPDGWLECDGAAISRTTYAELFAAIGTQYGSGDGTTTFNLPNGKGRSIVGYHSTETEFDAIGETGGEKTHILTIAEMPSHRHSGAKGNNSSGTISGGYAYQHDTPQTTDVTDVGSGGAHNNLPPYIVFKHMIKVTA
jgi:microcystin-dependent protein